MEENINYTYIVKCADGTYYTGWTNCIERRLIAHNNGKGAKYTRARGPVELVYLEISATKEMAMSREAQIKSLTRRAKEKLIAEGNLADIWKNEQKE
jgi:putative endonuclease